MAKINRINPEGISKPFSNYSHVVTAEGAQKLVFCAGQVAADVDGKVLPPDDFDAQAKMVMANLTKALAAGGAKLSDVTKITIYLCQSARRAEGARAAADLFRRPPARQHALHPARARQSEFSAGDRGDRRGVIFPGSGAVEGRVPAAVRAGTFHIIAP
jgi:enamine deaminase RidA (YjgF/YER057c/UK114 family)